MMAEDETRALSAEEESLVMELYSLAGVSVLSSTLPTSLGHSPPAFKVPICPRCRSSYRLLPPAFHVKTKSSIDTRTGDSALSSLLTIVEWPIYSLYMLMTYTDRTVRKMDMFALRKNGKTLQEIGDVYKLSRERVRQILNDEIIKKERLRKRKWLLATHNARKTCFICRDVLDSPRKFCVKCIQENKLDVGGKELPRGIVRGRDNNTCQVCGLVWDRGAKKRLDVHHLAGLCGKRTQAYDKPELFHLLITVCHKCHYNLHDHRKYGRKSLTRRVKKP